MTCPIKNPTCHRETEKECPTRTLLGQRVCWLGAPPVVYEMKPRVDGKIDYTLSLTHRQFLVMLATQLGGETAYDWEKLKPETRDHMRKLIEMRLLTETPIVGSNWRVVLKLTSAGANIVTKIQEAGGA